MDRKRSWQEYLDRRDDLARASHELHREEQKRQRIFDVAHLTLNDGLLRHWSEAWKDRARDILAVMREFVDRYPKLPPRFTLPMHDTRIPSVCFDFEGEGSMELGRFAVHVEFPEGEHLVIETMATFKGRDTECERRMNLLVSMLHDISYEDA